MWTSKLRGKALLADGVLVKGVGAAVRHMAARRRLRRAAAPAAPVLFRWQKRGRSELKKNVDAEFDESRAPNL
ncbi:MAG TPA: hypothetical protein VFK45_09195 [Gammaproteobacteria bacterium]|nr:hypothetical protein [Gammaproteobacteria bacterium]